MSATTDVFADPDALAVALAGRIAAGLSAAVADGRYFVLGCPGGRSLAPAYAALARLTSAGHVDTTPLLLAMMDEYVVATGTGFAPIDATEPHSCRGFGRTHLVEPLGLAPTRLLLPDPADPAAYEQQLANLGGVDLFLLATGSSDGHVAFNPPGTPANSRTRIVELAATTRSDNLRTFPHLRTIADVPTHGVTVGTGTITRLSRAAVLVATGPEKRAAVRRLRARTEYDAEWPATVVHACRNGELYLDRDAAGHIDVTETTNREDATPHSGSTGSGAVPAAEPLQ